MKVVEEEKIKIKDDEPPKEKKKKNNRGKRFKERAKAEHPQLVEEFKEAIPKELEGLIERTREIEVEIVQLRERRNMIKEILEKEIETY